MRTSPTIHLLVPCCLAIVAGCAESHGPPIDARELPEILARAECETLAECSMAGLAIPSDPMPWIDVEQCVRSSSARRAAERRAAPWIAAVERGEAWIDSAAVERCVEAVHDATCLIDVRGRSFRAGFPTWPPYSVGAPGLPGFHPSCDAMFVGRRGLAIGEACEGPLDCALGAYCGEDDDDPCTPTRCIATATAGDACDRARACGGGLACVEGRCVPRVMQGTAEPGEACGWIDDGSGGVIDERCAPGAQCEVCLLGADCEQACVPTTATEGQRCGGASVLCEPPLVCSDLFDGTCRRLAYAAEGEPCDALMSTDVATYCDPEAGLACVRPTHDSPGVCLPRSAGLEGDRCAAIDEPCAAGLECRDRACAAPAPPPECL